MLLQAVFLFIFPFFAFLFGFGGRWIVVVLHYNSLFFPDILFLAAILHTEKLIFYLGQLLEVKLFANVTNRSYASLYEGEIL